MTALRSVIVVRSSVQKPATIPCDQRLFQGLSTASSVRAPSGRNRFHCRRTKTVGLRPTVLVRCLMAGMAGRRSGRNGCFEASAAGVLHSARTIPTVAGRWMRTVASCGRWLVYQSLRTLEPPHTHKFPRVNAQDCKLGPIQPWDVKDFLRPGRGRSGALIRNPPLLLLAEVLGRSASGRRGAVADDARAWEVRTRLAAGLGIMLGHNIWSGGALPVVITLLGWLIAIRGAVLLALPQDAVIKFFEALRYEECFYVYMGVTLALGVFLTIAGFSA